MLIDGNSLTYRAFFALPTDIAIASGQVTNAVFGFTSMLLNLVRDHKPDAIAVAFDRPEPTFRHEQVDDYKANRDAAPDILRQQMGLVRQVVETLQASRSSSWRASRPTTSSPRWPPRPATTATTSSSSPATATPTSSSRTRTSRCSTTARRLRLRRLRRGRHRGAHRRHARRSTRSTPRCGATRPTTCPACPGVGEKTAAKLITTYGGLDGIFEHLDEQTPKLRPEPGRARGPACAATPR